MSWSGCRPMLNSHTPDSLSRKKKKNRAGKEAATASSHSCPSRYGCRMLVWAPLSDAGIRTSGISVVWPLLGIDEGMMKSSDGSARHPSMSQVGECAPSDQRWIDRTRGDRGPSGLQA